MVNIDDVVDVVVLQNDLLLDDLRGFTTDIKGDKRGAEVGVGGVVAAANGVTTKVIIETCLLTEDEKVRACELALAAGADFVKTSTGFSSGGATAEDIKLMRETVGPDLGVKASGGIRSYEDVKTMIDNGATRIGASAGVKILKGESSDSDY